LPRRIQPTGVWWAAAAVVLVALAQVAFGPARGSLGVAVTVWDDAIVGWLAGLRIPGLTGFMEAIVASTGSVGMIGALRWGILLALLVLRRIRHLVVFVGSFLAVLLAVRLATVDRPRPFGVDLRGSWAGWAMPSRPVAILAATLVGVLYTLVPVGRWRRLGKWVATGLVAAFALARVYLGVDAPTDALVAAVIGVAVSVAAYRLFVPSEVFPISYKRGRSAHLDVGGRRGEAIRHALADQLGLTVLEVTPFGLSGSAGSTPLRIKVEAGAGDKYVFGKLYARSHLRADRSYKLGRALLYGRLEDEKPFNTVKRLVQQEDYALALMQRAGLPSPEPYGVAELTPEREYLIVFEFIDGAKEIGEAEVDDAIIDQGLAIVRKLWDANLAHRDIKPANLLVRDGKLYLIDVFFAEIHPSPWRQAVDLANMMLCLALRSSSQQVYQRALQHFTVGEITEAFAAARGLALPSQLRKMMRAQGRNLAAEFVRLLPTPPRPIGVQRWSTRRVTLLLLVLLVLIPAGVPMAWVFAHSSANPGGAAAVKGGYGSCTQIEELWLEAQSVPSASFIPCVQALPTDIAGALAVRDGESVLELSNASLEIYLGDQPRARAAAGSLTIRLTATCAVPTTGEGQTVVPGVKRFQLASTSEVVDVFPGGCVTYQPAVDIGRSAPLLDQAQRAVTYRTRDDLHQALRRRSGGRLQLYPEGGN
jgi:tRNA A-37 threonylcarbamoyl transferase component Bud32/membrane-associated phospholipid phosphatase